MSYYYLAAGLPLLTLGDPPPLSSADFLFRCQGALSDEDHKELRLILDDRAREGVSDFARDWLSSETQICNTIAMARATRAGVEVRPYLHSYAAADIAAQYAASDAMSRSQPLEREFALDRCRWNVLEELASRDPYGLDAILAFGAKLQLAERWAALSEDAGRETVETFIRNQIDRKFESEETAQA